MPVHTLQPSSDPPEQSDKVKVYTLKIEGLAMKEEDGKDKEYDPHKHGTAKHPTTYLETLVHLFKGTVGTGVLSLPAAFIQSGYIVGAIGVLITTYFSTYCAYILAKSEVELCRRRKIPGLSYQATTEAAVEDGPAALRPLAPMSLHFCNILLLVAQISSACVYMIFIASNVKAVTDVYLGIMDVRLVMLWCAIPLLLVSCIRRLKYLAPFSTIGSLTVLASCGVVFYYMLQDIPPLDTRRAVGPLSQLPQFFGSVFFATGCISLVLPLQNEMKHPGQFTEPLGVLNVGSIAVAILYTLFGLFGYLKFGDRTAGSVTLNLPPDHISAHVVQLMLSVATLFGTTLIYYVAVTIMMETYVGPLINTNRVPVEYGIRICLVVITVVVAELVPNLELLVSLAGVLSHCSLATTLPCVIHMLTFYKCTKNNKTMIFLFVQDAIIIVLTSIIFVTGMTANIKRVIQMYE